MICTNQISGYSFSTDAPRFFYMIEEWKDIEWYEWKYQINNLGKVKSMNYRRTWIEIILKPRINKYWYEQLNLLWNTLLVHRIVAKAFIQNPNNLPIVMHLDNNTLNNNVTNLKWWTNKDNTDQMWNEWRANNFFKVNHPMKWKFWKNNHNSRKVNQYTKKWEFIWEWDCIRDIERKLWIYNSNISACCKGNIKSAWWFIWKYL